MPVSAASITSPFAWTDDLAISTARLNQHLGNTGNMQYLLDYVAYFRNTRPSQKIVRNAGSDYTTTSATFVDVDATNLKLSLAIDGTRALVIANAYVSSSAAGGGAVLDVILDSTTRAGDATYGLFSSGQGTSGTQIMTGVCFAIFNSLTAGTHDFKLQFRAYAGTGTTKISSNGQPVVMVGFEF